MAGRQRGIPKPFQRADGRWSVAVSLGTEPGTGKRLRQTLYGATRAEVLDAYKAFLIAEAKGEVTTRGGDKDATVADLLAAWLDDVVLPQRRPKTYEGYEYLCRLYLVPRLGRFKARELTARHVDVMITTLQREGVGATTIKNLRSCLRTALGQGMRWEIVARNAAALSQPPPAPERRKIQFTDGQARQLLTTLRASDQQAVADLFIVCLALGLRISEAIGIRLCDIEFADGVPVLLTVRVQLRWQYAPMPPLPRVYQPALTPPKTEKGTRPMVLPQVARQALLRAIERTRARQWRNHHASAGGKWTRFADDNELVFRSITGGPMIYGKVLRTYYQILDNASVPRVPPPRPAQALDQRE